MKKDNNTIKERTINLNLSDNDIKSICEMAGKASISVSELIENFIVDLTDGVNANRPSTRKIAQNWFDNCWFSITSQNTLLAYLLETNYMDDFIELSNNIKDGNEELENFKNNPNDYTSEEIEIYKNLLIEWKKDYNKILSNFIQRKDISIESEIELVEKWYCENERLMQE